MGASTAAALLREKWTGKRIVNLEGPEQISPNDIAASFSRLLGKPVTAAAVARSDWEELFRAQGMQNPTPRMQMLDGFNEGWIGFSGQTRKGTVRLHKVLARSVALDGTGRGAFTFTSPRKPGFYLGRITFGGTALILPGRDADMYLGVFSPANPRVRPSLQFVDPSAWAACP